MESITVQDICKRYGKTAALDHVSFSVEKGSIFGIIGPDGAGKSTLIRTLATLITPDCGTARIDGLDLKKDYRRLRTRIGYMPETFSLYQDLTVEENLEFYASLFNIATTDSYAVIAPVFKQLEPFRKRRTGKLSGGMKQKLALSCALIHQPDILLMDEPTRGVDPVSRKEFWNILSRIKEKGITILLSTSYMDEAMLCDQVGLFNHGHFLKTGCPDRIIREFNRPIYAIRSKDLYKTLLTVRQWERTESCYTFGDSLHILFKDDDTDTKMLQKQHPNLRINRIQPTIEDCFMNLLNK